MQLKTSSHRIILENNSKTKTTYEALILFNVLDFKSKTGKISKGISENIKEKQNLEFNLGPPICNNIKLHG